MRPAHRAFAELLRLAAGNDSTEQRAFRELDRAGWEELSFLVLDHALAIALADEVHRRGMPSDLSGPLLETARLHRLRTQVMLLDLVPVLAAMESAGTHPVVLKGAALAQVFGRPRAFGDLDVLVPPQELEPAAQALASIGYVEARTFRSSLFYERHHFHRVFRSPSGITLELHWALSRPSDYFQLDPVAVRRRSTTVGFQGAVMRVPCPSDQLLHAAAQSLREGFSEARRVLDAAVLLQAGGGADPELVERARGAKLVAALWVLLRLTDQLTGSPASAVAGLQLPRWQRGRLESLDLPLIMLEKQSLHQHGIKTWIFALCAPTRRTAVRTLWRIAFPGERGLLDDGHQPGALPGSGHRMITGLKRMALIAAFAGSQRSKRK